MTVLCEVDTFSQSASMKVRVSFRALQCMDRSGFISPIIQNLIVDTRSLRGFDVNQDPVPDSTSPTFTLKYPSTT